MSYRSCQVPGPLAFLRVVAGWTATNSLGRASRESDVACGGPKALRKRLGLRLSFGVGRCCRLNDETTTTDDDDDDEIYKKSLHIYFIIYLLYNNKFTLYILILFLLYIINPDKVENTLKIHWKYIDNTETFLLCNFLQYIENTSKIHWKKYIENTLKTFLRPNTLKIHWKYIGILPVEAGASQHWFSIES